MRSPATLAGSGRPSVTISSSGYEGRDEGANMKSWRSASTPVRRRSVSSGRMSEAQPRTQQPQGKRLALADLRSVRWVASQPPVQDVYNAAKPRYLTLKQVAMVGWFIVINEMVLVWWWTFLHNLPWPQPALSLLDWTDTMTLRFLDYTQQRLEWWWDAWGVRLMWLRQGLTAGLDKYITIIDGYLLRVQDALAPAFTLLITPVRIIYESVYANPKERATSRPRGEGKDDSLRRGATLEGDVYEDEDTEDGGEDYLSESSTDSKRLLKNDSQGLSYNRLRTTGTAEGRLREAMYHRVKRELQIMRKNSIRISCGIVNYGRQMVEPYMRPYAESFLVYYQKWAREHEIPDWMTPLQEVWNSERRFLAKAIALVRALFVVYLAFLLRLVKGKKSRRTRSMRSESLRRRAQNLTCGGSSSSSLPLSPSALQQSSEPTPSPPLAVPASLQDPALKDDEEDLDGSQAKDSAIGSEGNHSDNLDSDHPIAPIDEGDESEERRRTERRPTITITTHHHPPKPSGINTTSVRRRWPAPRRLGRTVATQT
ncbi:uncharacterized protein [Panulirus ornatus]|uniref:uncharacterized protein isoform X1 n=1 Tax=Panulirus ornatus TaxID=150431 RepID=UPI003A857A81